MAAFDLREHQYDFIFAGGGLAGLSLAVQISRSPLNSQSILIVDRDTKQRDDRTFSFWSDQPGPFQQAACGSWEQLTFHAPGYSQTIELGRYRYHTIRGIDFYRQARRELCANPQVTFVQGNIRQLREEPGRVVLVVDDHEYEGLWAFDSRALPQENHPMTGGSQQLQMAFRGWEVHTARPTFQPQAATLMDFRTRANGDICFFYVLPFTERYALVEYTQFTNKPAGRAACDTALHRYLQTAFQLELNQNCQASLREAGSLPVTDRPFVRRQGERTLSIGLRGGRLKPSTGYAFTRIQRDAGSVVRSLLSCGHPFNLPAGSRLYALLDAIMLEVMAHHPERIPGIFTDLFSKNPIERVLRFLDEDAGLEEIAQLIATLPPGLFLKVLGQRKLTPSALREALSGLWSSA